MANTAKIAKEGPLYKELERLRKKAKGKPSKAKWAKHLGITSQRYYDLSRIENQSWCHLLLVKFIDKFGTDWLTKDKAN